MIKKYFFILIVSSLMVSCKAKKVSSSSAIAMSTKDVIRNQAENNFDKKTINARLKAIYKDKDNSQTITIKSGSYVANMCCYLWFKFMAVVQEWSIE